MEKPTYKTEPLGSYKVYSIGFILSLLLTFGSYFLVSEKMAGEGGLLISLVLLAVVQAVVQLLFFLHLATEPKPNWNLIVFLFMALVLVIIVIGSLWIMYHLDTRTMPPMDHKHMMHHESM